MPKNIRHKHKRKTKLNIKHVALSFSALVILIAIAAFVLKDRSGADPDFLADQGDAGQVDSGLPQQLTPEELAATGDDADETPGVIKGVISQGDTAGAILQSVLGGNEARLLIDTCEPVYSLAKIRAGQPYTIVKEGEDFCSFEYEVNNDNRLIVRKEEGAYVASLEPIEYEIQLEKISSEINSSLFLTMSDLGESASLAVRIAEIFAWEINFIRDIQPGDSFCVLVEKRFRDGGFAGYGAVLAAEFINQGSIYEAYSFFDSAGSTQYFNAAGDSLRRAFLKAPLSFTRISSGYNLQRKHPIFKEVRPHPAIDYAAPTGTPVKAIGNGTVTFRGWGKGAGNYIVLTHFNGYESMYLHLNGFASNLTKGKKVKQGEVIGYVGSTGYSTGPHLDFRMKKDGKYVNPTNLMAPRDESVASAKLNDFKDQRDLYRQYLSGRKDLAEYTLEKETMPQ